MKVPINNSISNYKKMQIIFLAYILKL